MAQKRLINRYFYATTQRSLINPHLTDMKTQILLISFFLLFLSQAQVNAQKASALKDLEWSRESPAGFMELTIPSAGSLLQGFIYTANGPGLHPTLLLLHGYPGNERNLDLAQAVRAHGWNVIYFNYRGSWGSQGEFSFKNCVEDVKNLVAYCRANAKKLKTDPNKIALFGHSMGGFVCLKALSEIPEISRGFALSTWDIGKDVQQSSQHQTLSKMEKEADNYFVLNKKSGKALFGAVREDPAYFNLAASATALSGKALVMLDEHGGNKEIASAFQKANQKYFDYGEWKTDHSFTNKRASLIDKVIAFLDRP